MPYPGGYMGGQMGTIVASSEPVPDFLVNAIDGNDANDGTPANPWKTITKVNGETFSAGATIGFVGGQTFPGRLTPPSAGTSGNPITFLQFGSGAKPIIDATGLTEGLTVTVEWVAFEDLDVRDADGDCCNITAANGTMLRCDFSGAGDPVGASGVRFHDTNANNWTITGGRSQNNEDHGYFFANGSSNDLVSVTSNNNKEDGIQWGPSSGDNNNVDDADIHDNTENALDCKAGSHTVKNSKLTSVSTQDVIIFQETTGTFTLTNNDIFSTSDRLLDALALDATCIITSSQNRYRGGKSGDQSVKLGQIPAGGTVTFNSKADVFDDDSVAVSAMIALRDSTTVVNVLNSTVNRQANGDGIANPSSGTLKVENTGISTTSGENIDSANAITVDNNAYHRQDGSSNDVVNDGGTTYAETAVVAGLDTDGQIGAPNLASTDTTNADYMRPNSGSPYEGTGDKNISGAPANDNNNEAFEDPRNIGAVKGTA